MSVTEKALLNIGTQLESLGDLVHSVLCESVGLP